jgi:hypothetical protein
MTHSLTTPGPAANPMLLDLVTSVLAWGEAM